MQLKDWLRQQHGRQAALARHLGIRPPQVADWISYDKPIPVHHMAAIEAFTDGDVSRVEMRPDDWYRIWPELAISDQKQPSALSAKALQATKTVAQPTQKAA